MLEKSDAGCGREAAEGEMLFMEKRNGLSGAGGGKVWTAKSLSQERGKKKRMKEKFKSERETKKGERDGYPRRK